MNDVWEITIEKENGVTYSLYCSQEVAEMERDEWAAYTKTIADAVLVAANDISGEEEEVWDVDGQIARIVHGFSLISHPQVGTAKQETSYAYRFKDVSAIMIRKVG